MGDEIRPFKIHVTEADLEDLRKRLRATRWPDPQTVPDWSQGVPLEYVQKVGEYWARNYDWRKIEARLNARRITLLLFCALAQAAFPQRSAGQAPVYEITPVESSIKFDVESSAAIKGTFSKWDATLTFQTRELSTGVLDIKIEADSVDTGSGLKNGKLRGKDFFNVKENPYITFRSTKITQTGPLTFELDGDFTIRGVTKKEKLRLTDAGKGTPTGFIFGTMAFDRKDYGMNSGIPFIKIANRVEVNVNLKWKRIRGLAPVFEQ